jgi:hypothetical protein
VARRGLGQTAKAPRLAARGWTTAGTPAKGSSPTGREGLVVASIGERARDLLGRLAGTADGVWHPRREDRETLMELSERLELDLPVDAFLAPEVALAFLRRALVRLNGSA